jgi:hypothetical protein
VSIAAQFNNLAITKNDLLLFVIITFIKVINIKLVEVLLRFHAFEDHNDRHSESTTRHKDFV